MKNTVKKLCVFITLICLCSSLFFSVSVAAENADLQYVCVEKGDGINPSVNPRFSLRVNLFSSRYTDEQKSAKLRDFLIERLLNMEEHKHELSLGEFAFDDSSESDVLYVDLSEFTEFNLYYDSANQSSTTEIIENAMNDIGDKCPKLFWYKSHYTFSIRGDYKVTKIGLRLGVDKDFKVNSGVQPVINEINSLTEEFDGYVESIVDLIPESFSDYEKILFVNDYLCANYKYDTSLVIGDAYDFFKKGKGVCQSYTLAFMAIMDELGIRCDSVASKAMNHIWNLVELNEKWYHIDVTWNDPCFEDIENDTFGNVSHQYFLLSSNCIKDSTHNHFGFDIENYGYEIGTEYDDAQVNFAQSFKSAFIELNGVWYNTVYNETTRICGLYAFDSPDFSAITKEDIANPVYSIGSWGYKGSFSYLTKYNDVILFNTPTEIYVFDGTKFTEFCVPPKDYNQKIYGFDIKDNKIRVQLSENPNKSGMENATTITASIDDLIRTALVIKDYNKSENQVTIYSPIPVDATLIFTCYNKNNRMIDCKFDKSRVMMGTKSYNAPVGFDTNGAETFKVMLFKNMTAQTPLCKSLEK